MAPLSKIIAHNAQFSSSNKICVFIGATAGIGLATLRRMYTILDHSTFYLLGRNEQRHEGLLAELRGSAGSAGSTAVSGPDASTSNPNPTVRPGTGNTLTWIETDSSLLAHIDRAALQILRTESHIDYLCLSPKAMPFAGHIPTTEGLDTCLTLSYYSRLRLIHRLLPLLRRAEAPRVVSILGGTMERSVDWNDMGCKKNWSMIGAMSQSILFTSLAFDHLAMQEEGGRMTFIHNTPGLVHTGSPRGGPSTKDGYLRWGVLSVGHAASGGLLWAFGDSLEEAGERHAYLFTGEEYEAKGSIRVDKRNEVQPPNGTLKGYQNDEVYRRVWDHTTSVWAEALGDEVRVE